MSEIPSFHEIFTNNFLVSKQKQNLKKKPELLVSAKVWHSCIAMIKCEVLNRKCPPMWCQNRINVILMYSVISIHKSKISLNHLIPSGCLIIHILKCRLSAFFIFTVSFFG